MGAWQALGGGGEAQGCGRGAAGERWRDAAGARGRGARPERARQAAEAGGRAWRRRAWCLNVSATERENPSRYIREMTTSPFWLMKSSAQIMVAASGLRPLAPGAHLPCGAARRPRGASLLARGCGAAPAVPPSLARCERRHVSRSRRRAPRGKIHGGSPSAPRNPKHARALLTIVPHSATSLGCHRYRCAPPFSPAARPRRGGCSGARGVSRTSEPPCPPPRPIPPQEAPCISP